MVAIDWKKQNNTGIAIPIHTNAQICGLECISVYVYINFLSQL